MAEIKPVAWAYEFHDFGDVWARHVILNRPDGGANPPTKHYGSNIRNVRPLYGPEAMVEIERLRDALRHIANAYTAHGYSDAMDAVHALKDMAKEALDGNS